MSFGFAIGDFFQRDNDPSNGEGVHSPTTVMTSDLVATRLRHFYIAAIEEEADAEDESSSKLSLDEASSNDPPVQDRTDIITEYQFRWNPQTIFHLLYTDDSGRSKKRSHADILVALETWKRDKTPGTVLYGIIYVYFDRFNLPEPTAETLATFDRLCGTDSCKRVFIAEARKPTYRGKIRKTPILLVSSVEAALKNNSWRAFRLGRRPFIFDGKVRSPIDIVKDIVRLCGRLEYRERNLLKTPTVDSTTPETPSPDKSIGFQERNVHREPQIQTQGHKSINSIRPKELRDILELSPARLLLLDVRPFKKYNLGHLRTAYSVPTGNQLHAWASFQDIEHQLKHSIDGPEFFRWLIATHLVVYDEGVPTKAGENFAEKFVKKCVTPILGFNTYVLMGGFSEFARLYPGFVEGEGFSTPYDSPWLKLPEPAPISSSNEVKGRASSIESSTLKQAIDQSRPSPSTIHGVPSYVPRRFLWRCKCGYISHDDIMECVSGAVAEIANELQEEGYISHWTMSTNTRENISDLIILIQNLFISIPRIFRRQQSSLSLPSNTNSTAARPIALGCLQSPKCRFLHLCLDKVQRAWKLQPVHLCKDENGEEMEQNDGNFFNALRKAYFGQRRWKQRLFWKLKRIDFIEFELCPENEIGHIIPNKMPPTVVEYDFMPAPPLKKIPPIASEHMKHVFLHCSEAPQTTSYYLHRVPKRRNQALAFKPENEDKLTTGWGLHFVETINISHLSTMLFVTSLITAVVFSVCWSVLGKDMQGAFGVAAFVVGVANLGVVSWQVSSM